MSDVEEIVSNNREAVEAWVKFMKSDEVDSPIFEEKDFDSLSVGFFMAKGISIEDAEFLSIYWDRLGPYLK